MSELLPCECGQPPSILRRTSLVGGLFRTTAARVECVPCQISTGAWHDAEADAIAAWNCRATPAEIEALRAERDAVVVANGLLAQRDAILRARVEGLEAALREVVRLNREAHVQSVSHALESAASIARAALGDTP